MSTKHQPTWLCPLYSPNLLTKKCPTRVIRLLFWQQWRMFSRCRSFDGRIRWTILRQIIFLSLGKSLKFLSSNFCPSYGLERLASELNLAGWFARSWWLSVSAMKVCLNILFVFIKFSGNIRFLTNWFHLKSTTLNSSTQ